LQLGRALLSPTSISQRERKENGRCVKPNPAHPASINRGDACCGYRSDASCCLAASLLLLLRQLAALATQWREEPLARRRQETERGREREGIGVAEQPEI
jgi:hypothetical protein